MAQRIPMRRVKEPLDERGSSRQTPPGAGSNATNPAMVELQSR
jgi:hypothetical protein